MGTFIHALDAETGRVLWTNSGSGSTFTIQQHGSPAFAGAAPQGYLAVEGDNLLVSGGRTVPAVYARADGAFRYFNVSSRQFDKSAGGYEVAASGEMFFNGGAAYVMEKGVGICLLDPVAAKKAADAAKKAAAKALKAVLDDEDDEEEIPPVPPAAEALPILTDDGPIILVDGGNLLAYADRPQLHETVSSKGVKKTEAKLSLRWKAAVDPALSHLHLKAGGRFYASGSGGRIVALEVPPGGGEVRTVWQGRVEGDVWTLLAADGRLFAVTRQGGLYAFGAAAPQAVRTHAEPAAGPPAPADGWSAAVEALLRQPGAGEGYGVVLGVGAGRLIEELLRQSSLRLIAVDPDEKKVAALRDRFERAGLYGRRIAVLAGDPATFVLPPYMANLIVSEDVASAGLTRGVPFVRTVFSALRPYGGRAWLPMPAAAHAEFAKSVAEARLEKPSLRRDGEWSILAREGALPDSADWTHQYADVANTVVSQDARVKAPLGLLWFGGPPNDPILPRHGHGPTPQVIEGRLLIEGRHVLRAVDIYTGRLLWQQELKNLGEYYDNTIHQPGANEIGSNYASASDGIYVAYGAECLRLDPATGRILARWPLPPPQAADGGVWG
ncbi:MAG: PQQ-binding-like beta-propeller repeat protein, partial [Planctomycetota bacterium]|nr:PQQ-binding-like beta-propeller repeat protein [Planctomycetota bacterium]